MTDQFDPKKFMTECVDAVEARLESATKKVHDEIEANGTASAKAIADAEALAKDFEQIKAESEATLGRMKELEQLVAAGAPASAAKYKPMGAEIVDSDQFKASIKNGRLQGRPSWDVQANTIIGEGGSPQDPVDTVVPTDRLPGIVPGAFRSLNILDFMPMGRTSSNQIEYTRELSWTNDAAETAEGGQKPESDLTFELVNEPVRTVAHWIKASRQILEDAPALQSYIDLRMRHGVRLRLQNEVIAGNGTSPNLEGLTSTNKSTAFTPTTGDNQFDSLNRAKYAVIAAEYDPNFIMLNPADWGAMERLKVSSSDDRYLVASANAAISYIGNGLIPMIWGLPVVMSNSITSGKFFLGASSAMMLFMRQDATVEMFEQDDTNVQKNLITIRAELRAALASFTPTAIRYGSLVV